MDNVLIFLLALSIVVLFHELGHFWAARRAGVLVEEFGLGIPPKIWGKKIGETIYSINALPIGGFCRLKGEDGNAGGKRSFASQKPWRKLTILLGGVVMNLVLAVLIFIGVYALMGVPLETNRVRVVGIAPGSPAEEAGLKEDDWVCQADSTKIEAPDQLIGTAEEFKGEKIKLTICGDEERVVEVAVRPDPPEGEGAMGVAISNIEMVRVPWWQFYKGVVAGFKEAYFWGKIIVSGVISMITTLFKGQIPEGVAGPLGMFQATSSIKQEQGLLAMIHFFGIISVNLAVFNFLPFPALDGGRMMFVLWEMISGKKVKVEVEAAINSVGFMILLLLLLLVTVGDVIRVL